MHSASRNALIAATLLSAVIAGATEASAGRFRGGSEGNYVTAYSRFGNGSVSGPVRPTNLGYQVRLPGGAWVGCRTSCSETLRVQTVDIFENNGSLTGYGTILNECGIFGCLEMRRSLR
jgi:hypothetical protein